MPTVSFYNFRVFLSKSTGMCGLLFNLFVWSLCLLCLVDLALAGFTSSFIRSEWPSIDIPFDSPEFAVPDGYNVPQQVHITQGDYDGKAVIVSWVTISEPGSNVVLYGKSKEAYNLSAQGKFKNYTFYNYRSGYIHHCLLSELEHNTKYYYKIGTGNLLENFGSKHLLRLMQMHHIRFGIIGYLNLHLLWENWILPR
ncbi:hypothetical protein HPP92_003485 [Vanilla planifolia]|uniref:Purple acid phosphatase N-terminal domain-containing protein n=1 Tax=Vanilla planifolia TaxID=51239 RepID=A0A835S6A9_VANPL|nr:hypothetical protein HPP92_003485 [Vanilla planifolia]